METQLTAVLAEKARRLRDAGNADGHSVYQVSPDANAAEAVRVMCDANVGCVLVVEDGKLSGLLSERDVMRRIANRGIDPGEVRVRDVMTTDVVTVKPGMTVEDALIQCTDRRTRHLPVSDGSRLLGLLSIGDLVSFVVKDKDRTIADLIDYIHGPQINV